MVPFLYGIISIWYQFLWYPFYMVPFLFGTISTWYLFYMVLFLYGTMKDKLDPNSLVLIHPVLWILYICYNFCMVPWQVSWIQIVIQLDPNCLLLCIHYICIWYHFNKVPFPYYTISIWYHYYIVSFLYGTTSMWYRFYMILFLYVTFSMCHHLYMIL